MSCHDIQLKLPDFVAGHVAEDDARAIERHLIECGACRAMGASVRELYAIPEPDFPAGVAVPARLEAAPAVRARRRISPAYAGLAAAVVIAVTIGVAFAAIKLARYEPRWQPLALLDVKTATLPEIPRAYAAGEWIENRVEAEAIASFTGRPLLEACVFTFCPNCVMLEQTIAQPEARESLAGFVMLRCSMDFIFDPQATTGELPPWMPRDAFIPPMLRISSGEDATQPRGGITSQLQLDDLIAEWHEQHPATRTPLGVEELDRVRADLERVPGLVAARRFTEAVTALNGIVALAKTRDGDFARPAHALLDEIDAGLERQLAGIERLAAGDRVEQLQARDLARRFLAEVGDLPIAKRVAPYAE